VVLAVLVALLLPPALQNATENEANESRLRAADLERIRRGLVTSQRPRRAVLDFRADPAPALATAVRADAARRVVRGELDGPLGDTTCRPIQRSDVDPRAPVFTCLVEQGIHGEYQGRELVSGYRFRGRVELARGQAAWCSWSCRCRAPAPADGSAPAGTQPVAQGGGFPFSHAGSSRLGGGESAPKSPPKVSSTSVISFLTSNPSSPPLFTTSTT
jgi:hypothetical protein